MEVFRISQKQFSKKLTSSGSESRWNLAGEKVIYCGSSRSLSSLEMLVQSGSIKPSTNYSVMVISIADKDHLFKQVYQKDLPPDWRSIKSYADLQKMGSLWFKNQESLILKVPSAVIPHEYNYVINTKHPEFSSMVKLVRNEEYFWDERLFKSTPS